MQRFLLAALLSSAPAFAADTYEIDTGHSAVMFAAHHFNAGYTYGRFNSFKGEFTWDKDKLADISLSMTIDANSFDSGSEKRDKHLKNADNFNTAEFPEITFTSKACTKKGDNYMCTGALTMAGKTSEVSFEVEHTGQGADPWGGFRLGLHSVFTIERSDWGMTDMAEGVSDKIKVIVSIEGKKK